MNVNIQNNNAYLKAFGVRIEEGIKARAQVLHPPAITYNENEMKRVEPNQRGEFPDRWMLTHNDSKKFTQPCQLAAGFNPSFFDNCI